MPGTPALTETMEQFIAHCKKVLDKHKDWIDPTIPTRKNTVTYPERYSAPIVHRLGPRVVHWGDFSAPKADDSVCAEVADSNPVVSQSADTQKQDAPAPQ